MAVASESKVVSARKRRRVVEVVDDENENEVVDASEISKAKRTSCPGVRVKGNRIYDSENGKTCHQCRQKTRDFTAPCKNMNLNKLCTINFCHKCLLNRYGEKAEDVAMLDDWKCPKCRGICNCSICMKRRGHKPTGQLVITARKTGYSSVSEMLNNKDSDNLVHEKVVENIGISPKKPVASNKEPEAVSPRIQGKENSFDGKTDANLNSQISTPNTVEKKSKKTKREELKEISNGSINDDAHPKKSSPKKPKVSEVSKKEAKTNGKDNGVISKKNNSKTHVSKDKKEEKDGRTQKDEGASSAVGNDKARGASLVTVADIDLPPEDVGHALQFLEFCASFGKVIDVRKGQAESLLRELRYGRRGRRSQYSMNVQFHIQLLSLIQKDVGEEPLLSSPMNGRESWCQALGKFISESPSVLNELLSDSFNGGVDEYDKLDFSMKLRILNFLCDKALGTVKLRSWIDDQNSKVVGKEKEAKEKLLAAKDKEKHLKKKLQDEVAKAIIAKSGALSIAEHDAIVSQIKSEAAQAHAERLDAMGMVSKSKQKSDAIRTEAIFLDVDGRAFWKLKGYTGEDVILLQDTGTWDAVASDEKWFVYGAEQKQAIEKYISFSRVKRERNQNVAHTVPRGSNVANI
nr:isoform 4 of cell division cycle-associated 7-like protein [Quercus suber]